MNTLIKTFCIMICGLAFSQAPQATLPETSIAGLMKYESAKVNLATGIPDISLPMFTLPTRSNDISIGTFLSYHPSGARFNEPAGLSGKGWTLVAGGAISRTIMGTPDECNCINPQNVTDLYQFNFLGKSGRFYIIKDENGIPQLKMLENSGEKLEIQFAYNSSTGLVDSFTVFDNKGYKYVFDVFDTFTGAYPYITVWGGYVPDVLAYEGFTSRNAYHLTMIIDPNNKTLASFSYVTFDGASVSTGSTPNPPDHFKKLDQITVPGFGSISFTYAGTSMSEKRYAAITLKDLFGNIIRRAGFDLDTDGFLTGYGLSNSDGSLSEQYTMSYRHVEVTGGDEVRDIYGYSTISPGCSWEYESQMPNRKYCTKNVLEKIVYPTGGCVIYDFESNSFSEYTYPDQQPISSQGFYSRYADENTRITTTLKSANWTPATGSTITYTYSGTSAVDGFIRVTGEPYQIPEIEGQNGNNDLFPGFSVSWPGGGATLSPSFNKQNRCLGYKIMLQPGVTYTFNILTLENNTHGTGTLLLQSSIVDPNYPPMNFGGGVRIKRIIHFDKDVFPDAYYLGGPQAPVPAKETNYAYNFFDSNYQNLSSGVCVNSEYDTQYYYKDYPSRDFVNYKNVKVWDTGGNGWDEFTFTTANDFGFSTVDSMTVYYDYRRGLLTDHKSFSQTGALLQHDSFIYSYLTEPFQPVPHGFPLLNANAGWTRIANKTTRSYPDGTSHYIQSSDDYTYDFDTRCTLVHTFNPPIGSAIKTEYVYHVGNSVYTANRVAEIAEMRNYRGTELLSTDKINYSNSWPAINEGSQPSTGNASWLPQTTENKKADRGSFIQSRMLSYDQYGHPVELQQENGVRVVFIYGYNSSLLVAKIENATLSLITASLITAVKNASDMANNEANLIVALDNLRGALPDAMVTTYTYKPLTGVSTVTDARGDRQRYEYDGLGRLLRVRNARGQILSETEYHLKGQL